MTTRLSLCAAAIPLLTTALLAACSPDAPEGTPATETAEIVDPATDAAPMPEVTPAPTAEPAAIENATMESSTIGGDGSPITLNALTTAEIDAAKLAGELNCHFASANQSSLLVAAGYAGSDEPAQAIVKIASVVEPLRAPGGFNAMVKGTTFTGRGTVIRIELTGPATAGGESPPRPATLTFDRGDGARRVIGGTWNCGP